MMLSEFIERTHFYPTQREWSRIQEDYNESPITDKDVWCKQWRKKEMEGASQRAANMVADLLTQLEMERQRTKRIAETYDGIIATNKAHYEARLKEQQRYNDETESLLNQIRRMIENR